MINFQNLNKINKCFRVGDQKQSSKIMNLSPIIKTVGANENNGKQQPNRIKIKNSKLITKNK